MARARSNCFCASGEHEVLNSTRPSFSWPPLREAGVVSAQLDTTRNSETTAATTVTESFMAASLCWSLSARVTGSQASIYLSEGKGSSRNMPLQCRPQQQCPRYHNLDVPQSLPNRETCRVT